jgi:cyclopropane fatty-acyl-phospholipid synthase-like methyltransferase
MNPNKALWEKGDFTRLAETMRESGEALVNDLGITKGLEVLDLGCGDGMTALPRRGWAPRCWASTSRATWSRRATDARRRKASQIAGFRKATPAICGSSLTIVSTS